MKRPLEAPLRAVIAVICGLSITVPASAYAKPPAAPASEGPPTEVLNEQAERHVIKAFDQYNNRAFAYSEAEFQRAAFFAPRWRPLHFNLGVVAEAQGKLGTAIKEYRLFRPFASPDEESIVDQRIAELDSRRRRVAGNYKRQIALGAGIMAVGVGAVATGAVLFGLNYEKREMGDQGYTTPEEETKRSKLRTGGLVLAIYGVLVVGLAMVPLSRAIKSKRQLDGLALGKTRLQLTGGGATLRF